MKPRNVCALDVMDILEIPTATHMGRRIAAQWQRQLRAWHSAQPGRECWKVTRERVHRDGTRFWRVVVYGQST